MYEVIKFLIIGALSSVNPPYNLYQLPNRGVVGHNIDWHFHLSALCTDDWSGEAAGARLRVNFMLKLLLSQNFCNRLLMRFISFASNIGPTAAVPAGPASVPLHHHLYGQMVGMTERGCPYSQEFDYL